MFDRLIGMLLSAWSSLLPFVVVDETEEAMVLRLGKFNRVITPGFHWVWPIIEFVLADNIVTRVVDMRVQSLVTSDNVRVLISTTLQWRINNFKDAMLKIEDVEEAVPNACFGVIGKFVRNYTWEGLVEDDIEEELRDRCRKRVQKYGALVEVVEVCDLSTSRTIRLINE